MTTTYSRLYDNDQRLFKNKGISFLGKEPRLSEMLAEGGVDREWAVRTGSYKCKLGPCD
jgi:hypothetical protein